AETLAAVSGADPREDPWRPERLTWPLLEVLDEVTGGPGGSAEPWAAPLARYLRGHGDLREDTEETGLRDGRRLSLARWIARLFASYAEQRPGLEASWAAPKDGDAGRRAPYGAGEGEYDDAGTVLPPGTQWQPELWRRVRGLLGEPGPAERLPGSL